MAFIIRMQLLSKRISIFVVAISLSVMSAALAHASPNQNDVTNNSFESLDENRFTLGGYPLDIEPVFLSIKLATITTCILLLITIPLAYRLTFAKRSIKSTATALASLPLVLPPSVLGFYLLLSLGSQGPIGRLSESLGLGPLAFSFPGLVIASVIYSFPFALQPTLNAFENIGRKPLEAAATLGASTIDRFFTIAIPLAKPGILAAAVLSFAHTLGEFGVILMIGGNIPGETKVLSLAIYDHVEALEYSQAHVLSAGMLLFSFAVLFFINFLNSPNRSHRIARKGFVSNDGASKGISSKGEAHQ